MRDKAMHRSLAAVLAAIAVTSCAAVYPEVQTPLRAPNATLDPPPPKDLFWIAFKSGDVPEKTRDGRDWAELGSKLPDPVATLFVNGKELIKTNVQSSTLHATWEGSPKGNFRIKTEDKIHVEMWEAGLVDRPLCQRDMRGDEQDWVDAKQISIDCDSGAHVTIAWEPAHGRVGYGFYYELRTQSVYVTRVFEESPAARAGIKGGDELVNLGDRAAKTMSPADVQSYLAAPKREGIKLTVRTPGVAPRDIELKEGAVYPLFTETGAMP
jgi:hypothetical protein